MTTSEHKKAIFDILNRGTVDVLVKTNLEKKLLSGKKLRVKFGIDPSGADLHLGHMIPIRKLSEFQKLGHHILLLFGNFTGQIGDPTGKDKTRDVKTQAELEINAKHYLEQVKKVLDISKVEVVWNADWLKKLNFADIISLSANFTVSQMMERDMFQERVKAGAPISVHEFMYPLMQGYDSVALKADVEIGGTDQTFNMLAGRPLQKAYGQEPQDIITVPILEGTDGKIKMGKTTQNYIGVNEVPSEMYGKIMSIPDTLLNKYFELTTNISHEEIRKISAQLSEGVNPKEIKMRLAREIVTIYHSGAAALQAEAAFNQVFTNRGIPDNIPVVHVDGATVGIVELLLNTGLVSSKGEARRLVEGGGVKCDSIKVVSPDTQINLMTEHIIQAGKRKFIRISGKKA